MDAKEQLKLRIDYEVSHQMDNIIDKIQTLAKDFSIEQVQEKSPFRNVLTVSTELSTSLEVIKNFIRYQVGRKNSSKIWKRREGGEFFASAVVDSIDSLRSDIDEIIQRISANLNEEIDKISELTRQGQNRRREEDNLQSVKSYLISNQSYIEKDLHLNLTQLYLGYLSREHTARLGPIQE